MTATRTATIILALTLALATGSALTGDQAGPHDAEHAHEEDHAHGGAEHHHEALPLAPLAGDSLYHLEAQWLDQHESNVVLSDFHGESVLITMFYGNCTTACPLLLHRVRLLNDALPEPLPVLAVTFDPTSDTPSAMRTYAQERGFDDGAWRFLSGSPHDIRMLATLLGVRYQQRADGHFDHSNLIAVLDREGVVRLRTEGVSPDVDAVAEAIAELRLSER